MPSHYSRRKALCGPILGLGTAGCLDASSDVDDLQTTSDSTTKQDPTTSDQTTIAPSEVSDEEAIQRALAAEEEYLTERLQSVSCLQNWRTTPSTASEEATVTSRDTDGVHVLVTHPYWYSTENEEADSSSTARYIVANDSIQRVNGDDVSPC